MTNRTGMHMACATTSSSNHPVPAPPALRPSQKACDAALAPFLPALLPRPLLIYSCSLIAPSSSRLPVGCVGWVRLSCQIILTKDLEGMELELPQATRNFYVDGHVPEPH